MTTPRRTSRTTDAGQDLFREFRRTINMTPAQIRRWHASPLSKIASFATSNFWRRRPKKSRCTWTP